MEAVIAFLSLQHLPKQHLMKERVSDSTHAAVTSLCSAVEHLSPANEAMEHPPKKEEKKVHFSDFFCRLSCREMFHTSILLCGV